MILIQLQRNNIPLIINKTGKLFNERLSGFIYIFAILLISILIAVTASCTSFAYLILS